MGKQNLKKHTKNLMMVMLEQSQYLFEMLILEMFSVHHNQKFQESVRKLCREKRTKRVVVLESPCSVKQTIFQLNQNLYTPKQISQKREILLLTLLLTHQFVNFLNNINVNKLLKICRSFAIMLSLIPCLTIKNENSSKEILLCNMAQSVLIYRFEKELSFSLAK